MPCFLFSSVMDINLPTVGGMLFGFPPFVSEACLPRVTLCLRPAAVRKALFCANKIREGLVWFGP